MQYICEKLPFKNHMARYRSGNNPCRKSAFHDKYSEAIGSVQEFNSSHLTLEQLGTLLTIMNRRYFQFIGELAGKFEQIKFELEKSRQEVNTMEQTIPETGIYQYQLDNTNSKCYNKKRLE